MKQRYIRTFLTLICFYTAYSYAENPYPTGYTHTKDSQGATVRMDSSQKVIYLIFPADLAFEGANHILNTLYINKVEASFFLTGNCLRKEAYQPIIRSIVENGHYLGGHSDKHIQYAPWGAERHKSLVTADSLIEDLNKNMQALASHHIDTSQVKYYLPPYEWYNAEHVKLIESQGQTTINYTPGLRTAADYTTPDMKNYLSSDEIIKQLVAFEEKQGLNGAIILIHPGTHPDRTDKLYLQLDKIIKLLKTKGYSFQSF